MPAPGSGADLTGQQFGRWTVVSLERRDMQHSWWNCRCECGEFGVVRMNTLRRGMSLSCGCLMRERTAETSTTHGYTKGRARPSEYGIWAGMKNRCYNPTVHGYEHYGKRGIAVCDAWMNDFAQFIADMGPRPTLEHSIERIDNSKGYEPTNCIWATPAEQGINRRNNLRIQADGRSVTVLEVARQYGIPIRVVYHRIHRNWPEDQWFRKPRRSQKRGGNVPTEEQS